MVVVSLSLALRDFKSIFYHTLLACVESGGICRYNSTLQKHFCLCGEFRGQAYPTSCPNPPELPPASNFAESSMCPSSSHDFYFYNSLTVA